MKRRTHPVVLTVLLAVVSTVTVAAPSSAAGRPTCSHYYGGSRPATIAGTSGDDVLRGTRRNDVIVARAGDDSIYGGGGHDLICAGGGRDRLDGGNGNDYVAGGPGGDYLIGGFRRLRGTERTVGGDGNDRLFGEGGDDGLVGGDRFHGGRGTDDVDLSADGPLRVDLAAFTARTAVGVKPIRQVEGVRGSGYNDVLLGDADDNVLDGGGGGVDRLYGRGGNDKLDADSGEGPGLDTAVGGSGRDHLYAALGSVLKGGYGNDTVWVRPHKRSYRRAVDGGPGRDTFAFNLRPNSEASVIIDLARGAIATTTGTKGRIVRFENARGWYGDDRLYGNDGPNTLWGGLGNDRMAGRGGTDVCYDYSPESTMIDCEVVRAQRTDR